jgi:hypothetical protein
VQYDLPSDRRRTLTTELFRAAGSWVFLPLIFLLASPAAISQSVDGASGVKFTSRIDWQTSQLTLSLSRTIPDSGRNLPAAAYFTEDSVNKQLPDFISQALLPIQVDSLHTVADLVESNPGLYKEFGNLLGDVKRGFPQYSEDLRTVTLPYTLDFYPAISGILVTHAQPVPIARTLRWVPTNKFTGLVIYAKGALPVHGTDKTARLEPCLFPDIYDEDMRNVVGKEQMDPTYLNRWGAAAYTSGFGEKKFIDRIGLSPLRIVATGLFGKAPTDPVISREDADMLLSSDNNRRLLAEGRILIIYSATEE